MLSVNRGVKSGTTVSIWNTVFIIPKKEGTTRFIMEYQRINQKLVRNPHPLTKICQTMNQLEGYQYANSLDLSMGYYTIRLLNASQESMLIVTTFWKVRYSRPPMGMCSSGDIFQAKLDKQLGDIEGVKIYIDTILVLRNKSLYKNINYLTALTCPSSRGIESMDDQLPGSGDALASCPCAKIHPTRNQE